MNHVTPGPRGRILLVEDEPAIRRLFRHTYDEFDLMTASSVEEAIALLQEPEHGIGVLLADHYLPDGTGVDVLAWARQKAPQTVRLLTTSHAHLSQAMAAVNDGGIAGYILKPWQLEDLRQRLDEALRAFVSRQQELTLLEGKRSTLMTLASSIAHEMRTPLASIRMRAEAIAEHWPTLMGLYQDALRSGHLSGPLPRARRLDALRSSLDVIQQEVDHSNLVIDMLLASANAEKFDTATFAIHSARECVDEALAHFPFPLGLAERVTFCRHGDARFYGSDVLLTFVLYNLIKNACQAIQAAGKGRIHIHILQTRTGAALTISDSGSGIALETLPRIFDDFFTTRAVGTGVGLVFCRRAMLAMGGEIRCRSRHGHYTAFRLRWPVCQADDQ
ncbi:hybrid sensor histidine kinase/response regulator [Alcanivorax sp. JB21]|uniref:sensor histidine kinase n=1 Tax=Alcanivorax limicola TaxID=2874102 RepID=UPI001CBD6A8F|nr:hybrid sensor histidine kinase/response regulator [Alcanivorax limicola]MBZ2188949.1 hybrid sensor histidine kinase/response regulator [Alcanivorax limicola]